MFISMNWISDFVDLSGVDIKALINRFTLSTAEVEDIYEFGKDTKDVVVGKILSVENHPNSKKLHLLKVDNGTEVVDVVCGAPNVFEGAIVAFAKAGGSVCGTPINEAQIAGYTSFGMCCSEKELGISEDHSGIMILNDFVEAQGIAIGTDIKSFIPLDDTIFEVDNKSLTNRPDLWGHYGIAREISCLLKRPLKPLDIEDLSKYDGLEGIDVKVETDMCYRYSCITVRNVTKNVAPLWMKVRLQYCGQRPINLLADLTNYLAMELGQPMHAFDNAKVKEIRVKMFDTPVEFQTLDSSMRTVEPGIMMICNEKEPVALAGIMGGLLSEIEEDTDTLLLESANFDGACVRKGAARLGMRTEASARYEKTLDPEMTVQAIARFLKLLHDVDPEAVVSSRVTDVYNKHFDKVEIEFDKAYVDKYTGIDISADEIADTLTRLEFVLERNGDSFKVKVPSFRATKDVTMKADIIEEITRVYGYDNFEYKSCASMLTPVRQDPAREDEYTIKKLLASKYSFSEVQSYIWYDNKANRELGIEADSYIKIINSLTGENEDIRSTIVPTLVNFVNKNIDTYPEVRMFEDARVVKGIRDDKLADEHKYFSMIIASREADEYSVISELKKAVDHIAKVTRNKDFDFVKDGLPDYCFIHPKNSASIMLDGVNIGYISVLNPKISSKIDKKLAAAVCEIDLDAFAKTAPADIKFEEISKYPGISIDLSLLTDKAASFGSLKDIVCGLNNDMLQSVSYVDVFEDPSLPAGKVSLTIRLYYCSQERTLLTEEVNGYVKDVLDAFAAKGISLRS
ncbi:MAG: phenylalanine--tRNA ligase subunit beta [Lachnospiraceae bacterium]|nr:phenylalanine--tRNA ligase subunit beta [Lachnospiraceae bacterium]